MTKTEEALLPCPFCGGRAIDREGIHTAYVQCLQCETMGPNVKEKAERVKAWNTRTPEGQEMWAVENEKGFQSVSNWKDNAELHASRSESFLSGQGPFKVVPVLVTRKEAA